MTTAISTFSNTLLAINNIAGSKDGSESIRLEFDPQALGVERQANGKYPPTIKITENDIETALLKRFGFDTNNSADLARVKQLLRTADSPFAALRTTGTFVAHYNSRTQKYEILDSVEKSLFRRLQGKADEIKTQLETENRRQSRETRRDELEAGRWQQAKLERLIREAQVLPSSFGIPSKLTDLTHVIVTLPEGVEASEDAALAAHIEKLYGGGNLWGDAKQEILNAGKANGVRVENLKVSPNNSRVVEFDLTLESVLKLRKAYLDVQEKTNVTEALSEKIRDEMALNQFLLGVITGAKDDILGNINMLLHPIKTLQDIRDAIGILMQLTPEDLKNIVTELGNKAVKVTPGEAAYGAGYVVGTVIVEIILAKGAGAALSALGKTKAGAEFLARIGKLKELANLGKTKIAGAFSDEAALLAANRLRARLAATTLYVGIPADALADFAVVSANRIKNGATKFSEFARQMVNDFGEKVKPYLEKMYREQMINLGLTDAIDEAGIKTTNINKLSQPGVYTDKIKWGIQEVEVRPDGKGFWGKRTPQSNARVDAFERKINPNNESYYVKHPNGGYVQFENLERTALQDGKLIVKTQSSIYRVYDKPEFLRKKILAEAVRQVQGAGYNGLKVEWLVSDRETVNQLTRFFRENGVDIKVKYFPE